MTDNPTLLRAEYARSVAALRSLEMLAVRGIGEKYRQQLISHEREEQRRLKILLAELGEPLHKE